MQKIQWKELIINLVVSLGTGGIAALLTSDSMKEYEQIYKPPLSPPGWIFPIVWTVLFILMGVAAYRISILENSQKKPALQLYVSQLVINVIWTVIFFDFKQYWVSFFCLLLLWYLIYLTIKAFMEMDGTAGKLMIPYLVWVTFAGYLNLMIALYYMKH